jgi:hypothetical protein
VTNVRQMRFVALVVALVGFGGCLELDSPDGALKCSTVPQRACPEGFYCLAGDNTCWRYGHFPEDMAESSSFFPGGPDDMSVPLVDDLSTGLDSGTPDDLTSNDDLSQTD